MRYHRVIVSSLLIALLLVMIPNVLAQTNYTYGVDLRLSTSKISYSVDERIELWGELYLNTTYVNETNSGSNYTGLKSTPITIRVINNSTNENVSTTTINTTSGGAFFYSQNDYSQTAPLISAPSSTGAYIIRANYTDPNGTSWYTKLDINVENSYEGHTTESYDVSSDKVEYYPGEQMIITIKVKAEVVTEFSLYLSNISVQGTIINAQTDTSTGTSFNCTTGTTGICTTTINAPSSYGEYRIDGGSKGFFQPFRVKQFGAMVTMKDELGKSTKYTYDVADQASVEVVVLTNSTSEVYTFNGIITNNQGTTIKNVNITTLNESNGYTNKFTFPLDALSFTTGTYHIIINITKSGGETTTLYTSFEVKSWSSYVKKRDVQSGFEYEYSAFPGNMVYLELYPTWRNNGSILSGFNTTTDINITLKDQLNNVILSTTTNWNATCGKEGCYQYNFTMPTTAGEYQLSTIATRSDTTQTDIKILNVITATMSAQSTDKDGSLKELYGADEHVYLSITAKNITSSSINLTNASISSVVYMNGSEISYTRVTSDAQVNGTNSINEWSWNITTQKLKIDTPRVGGMYTLFVTSENNTMLTSSRFIINPYDACVSAKNSPSSSSLSSGFYYVYQFKTTDTAYFELKLIQANNPTGRATFSNSSNSSNYGMGNGCTDLSTTRQVINNATITITEVRNVYTGEVATLNSTSSTCKSDDTKGAYTCTVQPLTKWDSGQYSAQFKVTGQDGQTTDMAYGFFESRSFYLYAYPTTWSMTPTSNVQLTVNMYEAGNNWWGNYGSGGMTGTVTLEKVEYQGRDGEWLWPPIEYPYNTSQVNKTTITTGTGTMTLPVNLTPTGQWKPGSYRAILKGVNNDGVTDYGYAWFTMKQWDVYSTPVDCSTGTCAYTYNINSKSNISLYVTINNAGQSGQSGNSLGGPLIIRVKKIQDCRKWPCTDLNSTLFSSTTINVSTSNGWYWGSYNTSYIINLTPTSGSWGTGYYNAVLDINNTETGTGWFNTIAFYTETRPTDSNGSDAYKYSIRNTEPLYLKVTTVRAQKNGYSYGSYSTNDYINTTIQSARISSWDYATYTNREYTYPGEVNISILGGGTTINGTRVINVTKVNGTWQTGYYWGELTMKNIENETSTGWINFQIQPFRVQATATSYTVDDESCLNASLSIYDPDWSSSTILNGTYNVTNVYENTWNGVSNTVTAYTNYTPAGTFNGSTTLRVCPNNGRWTGTSWGNYHYLSIKVTDQTGNTQEGWLSFQAKSFTITWGSISGNSGKTSSITIPVSVTRVNNAAGSSYLKRMYQWRYDNYNSRSEDYTFSVGSCYSNVSTRCLVTGSTNVIIYPPSSGWQDGYNYINSEWLNSDNVTTMSADNSAYFNARSTYYGWFESVDTNGAWRYNGNNYGLSENITMRLVVRDFNDASATVNITNVEYSTPSTTCWSDYCRTYNTATYGIVGQGNNQISGSGILSIQKPATNWTKGYVYIRATVQSNSTTGTIKDGYAYIKDLTAPTVNITTPSVGTNITTWSLAVNWTTSEPSTCWLNILNHQSLTSWYCGSTYYNISNSQACNTTKFTGTSYLYDYIGKDYTSWNKNGTWGYTSGTTGMNTGGTTHNYNYTITNMPNQAYGILISCGDEDWNYGYGATAIRINRSITITGLTDEQQLAQTVENFATIGGTR